MNFEYSITPADFLKEAGLAYKGKGTWISVRNCPFCDGGNNEDRFTFAVHSKQGHFVCRRTKCGAKGTFWSLLLHYGYTPKDYLVFDNKKKESTRFVYGR